MLRPNSIVFQLLICASLLWLSGCQQLEETPEDFSAGTLKPMLVVPTKPGELPTVQWVLASLAGENAEAPVAEAAPLPSLRRAEQELQIAHDALGKRFVLFASLTGSTLSLEPLLWSYNPIVYFQRVGSQVQLNTDPIHAATQALATPRTLATFEITTEDNDYLSIDFHQGSIQYLYTMKHPFDDLTLAGSQKTLLGQSGPNISGAYFTADTQGDDWFRLDQNVSFFSGSYVGTIQLRLTFWDADASSMQPLSEDPNDDVGYFVSETQKPGREVQRATHRWSTSEPITFYLSTNTPVRYREALREGILSWNSTFNQEFIRVEMAPDSLRAGDPRYPLVQWVDHDSGMGIGMVQAHPLTGEIFTGLIIMRAGWATLSTDALQLETESQSIPLHIMGHASDALCSFEKPITPLTAESGLDLELDAHTELRLVRRQLTSIVAHEIGHVLGLRHNFAGNLANNETAQENLDAIQAIIRGNEQQSAQAPSSSLMDYLPRAHILRMIAPGTYDQRAIAFAYPEVSQELFVADDANAPLYCSDEHRGTLANCAVWDSHTNPVPRWKQQMHYAAQLYNNWIIDTLIFNRNAHPRGWVFAHYARKIAQSLVNYANGQKFLPVDDRYPFEHRAEALAALEEIFRLPATNTHPLVSSELAGHIRRLQGIILESKDNDEVRKATHTLEQVQQAIHKLPQVEFSS